MSVHSSSQFARLRHNLVLGIFVWSLVLAVSLGWNLRLQDQRSEELAISTLRAAFSKDQAFRLWAARYGGVYVKLDSGVKPNPYLAHIGDRDLTATDGTELTLLNPASMLSQVMNEYAALYGITGRIVGQIALNPADLPDPWEDRAIEAFKQGVEEVTETLLIDGEPHLRLMRPMIMGPTCLKCHGHLGFKVGDVRGGVGVSMPLKSYREGAQRGRHVLMGSHFLFWFVGLLIILMIYRLARQNLSEQLRQNTEQELASHVIDDSVQGILITDAAGRIQRVNKMFTQITGFSADEALGKTPRLLRSERHGPEFYQEFWAALRSEGRWQGELWNRRKNGEGFPVWQNVFALRDENGTVSNYVSMFQDVTEQKEASERIRHLAHFDVLTGLPNRVLFEDRLKRALNRSERRQNALALLYIDLDDFKKINDSLGHAAGDQLLLIAAQRMQAVLRKEDTLARLGGDEFAVIAEEPEGRASPLALAEKLIATLAQGINLNGTEVFIGASIGGALYPEDGGDAATLLRNADTAMYRAKSAGRNRCHLYQREMSEAASRRLQLETSLRHAVDRGEFLLHYQPKVNAQEKRLLGCEALLRWQHPQWGLVSPAEFIPVAEESGLIVAIGEWVLAEACRQMVAWQQAHGFAGRISVNVSAKQLRQAGFVQRVADLLAASGLAADALELEITESALMENIDEARQVLLQLGELGLHLSIDDFGTGYSSLSYLKRLPFDCLKIDRSFVKDVPGDADDCVIVSTIIAMSRSLDMQVIAEGVETREQQEFLQREGCVEFQGYLFARPLPAVDFAAYLTDGGGRF